LAEVRRLLGALGDRTTALRLTAAAKLGSDAPRDGGADATMGPAPSTAGAVVLAADAERLGRSAVLRLARQAIAHHLAPEERPAPGARTESGVPT
jgi:hypothetical protein